MSAAKVSFETVFLREFARHYVSEIAITASAGSDMATGQVGLGDVLYMLRTGSVTISDKTDADGARWIVKGYTCHGRHLMAALHVWCDRFRVRVLRVFVGEGVEDV